MSNLLTVSRLRSWRQCHAKHAFEYEQAWRPRRRGYALRFGSLVHLALEAHFTGAAVDWDGWAREADIDEPGDLVKAQELLRGYVDHWGPPKAVLAVEVPFECDFVEPDLFQSHPTYRLAGKIDLILDDGDGRVKIVDHKTAGGAIDSDRFWVKLAMDPQISQYHVGAVALGYEVSAWMHDVIRKPSGSLAGPIPATPHDKRKYRKDGGLYANQRDEDEPIEEYRARLRADIAANPHSYYQRRDIPRTESQISAHLRDAWGDADHMKNPHRPRNTDACISYVGTCPFYECCSTGTTPEDHPDTYVRVDNVHPELEASTHENTQRETRVP